MASLPFTEARNGFSKMLDRVSGKKERISLSRRGKIVAAVVPIEDLALLEQLRAEEDAEDIREADKALRRYKRTGKAIPWEQIKKEAGLLEMVEYRIVFEPAGRRQFDKLSPNIHSRISRKLDKLTHNPRPHGIEKLAGEANYYRARVGEFRIIYTIEDDKLLILVVRIGARKDVYRKL